MLFCLNIERMSIFAHLRSTPWTCSTNLNKAKKYVHLLHRKYGNKTHAQPRHRNPDIKCRVSPKSSRSFTASTQQSQAPKSAARKSSSVSVWARSSCSDCLPASRTPSWEAGAVFRCQRETDPPCAGALGRCSLSFSSTNHTAALTSLPIFNFPGTSGSLLTFSCYRYWCFLPSITRPLLAAGKFPAPGEALAAVIGIIICGWYFSKAQREVEDDLWQTKWIVSKINSTPAIGMSNGKEKRGNSTAFTEGEDSKGRKDSA